MNNALLRLKLLKKLKAFRLELSEKPVKLIARLSALKGIKEVRKQLSGQSTVVNFEGMPYVPSTVNHESATQAWGDALSVHQGDLFNAAKAVYGAMKGTYVDTVIGKVLITGKGWNKVKNNLKKDDLRAKVVPYIPLILKNASSVVQEPLSKERADDFVAFYKFEHNVAIADSITVHATLKVGKRLNGNLVYHLLTKDALLDSAQEKSEQSDWFLPDPMLAKNQQLLTRFDGSVNQDDDGVNLIIVEAWDKNGNLIDLSGSMVEVKPVSEAIVLTGKEFGVFSDTPEGKKELRKVAIAHLTRLRGQWVNCPAIGEKVQIRNRGIEEFKRFSGNPLKLKAAVAMVNIIQSATYDRWEDNYKAHKSGIVGYHHLKSVVIIDNTRVEADVLIEKDGSGLLHYDYIVRSEKAAVLDNAALVLKAPFDHKSKTLNDQILHDTNPFSQAFFDSTEADWRINLILRIQNEQGDWIEVPDELEDENGTL